MQLTLQSVRFAMDCLEEFEAVHRSEPLDDKVDALDILMDSIGIDKKVKDELVTWLDRYKNGKGLEGPFLLGAILAAIALIYEMEDH